MKSFGRRIIFRQTHANRRWFSKNLSQKDERCLMRRTLVLSVLGKSRSLTDSLWSSQASCSSIRADKLSLIISGWNFALPGDDIFRCQLTRAVVRKDSHPRKRFLVSLLLRCRGTRMKQKTKRYLVVAIIMICNCVDLSERNFDITRRVCSRNNITANQGESRQVKGQE